MCIFYLLHELTAFNSDIPDGKRNARIFMLGIILYCLIYILIINLWDKNYFNKNICDAIFWAGLILFLSDVSIMGYIYRSYYGRSIMNEIDSDQDEWLWDEQTHKFYQISKIKIYKDDLEKKDKCLSPIKEEMKLQINPNENSTINILNECAKQNDPIVNDIIVDDTFYNKTMSNNEKNKNSDNNSKITKNTKSLKSSKSTKSSKPLESLKLLDNSRHSESLKSFKSSKSIKKLTE